MIEYGRSIRWFNDYTDEIEFSKSLLKGLNYLTILLMLF